MFVLILDKIHFPICLVVFASVVDDRALSCLCLRHLVTRFSRILRGSAGLCVRGCFRNAGRFDKRSGSMGDTCSPVPTHGLVL